MGLGKDLLQFSKNMLRSLSDAWNGTKEVAELVPMHQHAQADISEALSYLETHDASPDEAFCLVQSLVESDEIYFLVQNDYGISSENGPGLSEQIVELLHAANDKIEPETEQAVQLAELIVDNYTLSELLRKVPTQRSQELHDSLLEKCPEPIRSDLSMDYPKYVEEQPDTGEDEMRND